MSYKNVFFSNNVQKNNHSPTPLMNIVFYTGKSSVTLGSSADQPAANVVVSSTATAHLVHSAATAGPMICPALLQPLDLLVSQLPAQLVLSSDHIWPLDWWSLRLMPLDLFLSSSHLSTLLVTLSFLLQQLGLSPSQYQLVSSPYRMSLVGGGPWSTRPLPQESPLWTASPLPTPLIQLCSLIPRVYD